MKSYLDKKYMIADHTIIAYSGNNISLRIPEKINNISIREIGAGAFMELPELQYVMIPPKVKSIKMNAFSANPNLTSVVLPGTVQEIGLHAFHICNHLSDISIYDYQMDDHTYRTLKENSIQAGDGVYIARKVPNFKLVNDILQATRISPAACNLPDGINRLFFLSKLPDYKGFQFLQRNVNNISITQKDSKPITEDQGFMEYLKYSLDNIEISDADEVNDRLLRLNKWALLSKTAIFTFDDNKTKEINGQKSIYATMRFAYFFFPSACKVMCDGKTYYIYRKYYLSSEPDVKFAREDVAVYTDQGVVMDKKEAEKVYAKYKFLCIL